MFKRKVKKKIAAAEAHMKDMCAAVRSGHDNGSFVENAFRDFLRNYVPRHFMVTFGHVVDRNGGESEKADVIIVRKDRFPTVSGNVPGHYVIDDICAAGAVTTTLTDGEVKKLLESLSRFRRLESGVARGSGVALDEPYTYPPWFIFSFESPLTPSRIQRLIRDFERENTDHTDTMLKALFVVEEGGVVTSGYGATSPKRPPSEGTAGETWVWRNSDSVLYDFADWLFTTVEGTHAPKPMIHKCCLPGF